MPTYLYRCPNKHEISVSHGMMETIKTFCPICGEEMHKKPQVLTVKWSSFIEPSHPIRHHLENASRKRDEYLEKHHD